MVAMGRVLRAAVVVSGLSGNGISQLLRRISASAAIAVAPVVGLIVAGCSPLIVETIAVDPNSPGIDPNQLKQSQLPTIHKVRGHFLTNDKEVRELNKKVAITVGEALTSVADWPEIEGCNLVLDVTVNDTYDPGHVVKDAVSFGLKAPWGSDRQTQAKDNYQISFKLLDAGQSLFSASYANAITSTLRVVHHPTDADRADAKRWDKASDDAVHQVLHDATLRFLQDLQSQSDAWPKKCRFQP